MEQSVYLAFSKGTVKWIPKKIENVFSPHEKPACGPGHCSILHLIICWFLSYTLYSGNIELFIVSLPILFSFNICAFAWDLALPSISLFFSLFF